MGGFFPGKKYGGPPVSVDNFCSMMKDFAKCFIVTSNHDMGDDKPYRNIKQGWNDRGNAKVLYLSDEQYNKSKFEEVITDIKPDYIYLQGLFQKCVLPCLILAQNHHIKVVLAPRGELCAGAFRKKYKKIPYIIILRAMGLLGKNVSFQSTSEEETAAIAKYLGASQERIHLLTNIPSIPRGSHIHSLKNPGEGKFVFISRIHKKKNLLSAINYLRNVKGSVIFDIYGPQEDINYWDECQKSIDGLPPNVIVTYKGGLSHDEIHTVFSQYDAFLFPTLSENYGHVIAEALVTGCIPIISDQTPWNDMNETGAGWALPLNNEDAFKDTIQQVVDMDENTIQGKRKAIELYLRDKMKMEELRQSYLDMFKGVSDK